MCLLTYLFLPNFNAQLPEIRPAEAAGAVTASRRRKAEAPVEYLKALRLQGVSWRRGGGRLGLTFRALGFRA